MKYAFWSFGFIMIGLFGLFFIILFQDITINNEAQYYVLKEAMGASMLEAVDFACYRMDDDCKGATDLKMSEQKFVENFTKRFAKSISGTVQNYTIEFYDIMEKPPKATVVVKGKTRNFGIFGNKDSEVTFDLTNNLSGILEINNSICEFTDYFLFVLHIFGDSKVKDDKKSTKDIEFFYQTLNVDSSNIIDEGFVEIVKGIAGDNQMSLEDFYKYYKNTLSDNICDMENGFYCSSSSINTRYFINGRGNSSDINNSENNSKTFFLNKEIGELVGMSVLPDTLTINHSARRYFEDCNIESMHTTNNIDTILKFDDLSCTEVYPTNDNYIENYKYMSEKFEIIRTFSGDFNFGKGDFLSPSLYKITYNICK